MLSKIISSAALAIAASTLVSGQTFTKCQPLEKTCPADPAFGNNKVSCDFTQGKCGAFTELDGTSLKFGDKGAVFTIEKETNAPTIETGKYLFFGRVDVVVQAANGAGIVTSAVLQSDDLDEVDWEWTGGDNTEVQSNYFFQGKTGNYDRGAKHPVASPLTTFHTYTLVWTSTAISWQIDGKEVRRLNAADAQGDNGFPQTPMQVKLGTWVAGRTDAPKGTVDWAGGLTDFSQAPFNGYYKSVTIVDYAGTDGPAAGSVKEYVYGDHSGTWKSIQVKAGDGSTSDNSDSETTTSEKATTHTKTAKATTSTKAAATTTDAETTTSAAETTTSAEETKTTMSTASTAAGTTTAADQTSSATDGQTSATQVPGSAAPRNAIALGSVLAAAGVMFAQLL